ncbi:MAG: tetratricopeptide repeat protein [Chlamydiota bacterium]
MSSIMRIALCIAALCACGAAAAETVLVADFRAGGAAGEGDDALSLGLPYLIARTLNGTPGCQAILPDLPPSRLIPRLYDSKGMPDFEEASRLRTGAGADRCLLGRAVRSGNAADAGGASTVTFYLATSGDAPPEAFGADVAGDGCLPALAAWAAGKVNPASSGIPALKMPPGLLPSFSRGLKLLREGNPAGAERALLAAAKEYPGSPDARCLLGLAAGGHGKPYAALRLFNESANLDTGFSLPAYREGKLWLSLDRATLAESAFDRAAGIQPSFFEALLESGTLKTGRGDFSGAEGALRRAIKMRPRNTEARYRLADCLARGGKEDQAQGILAALVAGNGEHGPARYLLGRLLFQAGDYRAAELEARKAVRLMPDDPEAHTLLADSLSRQGGTNRHAEAAVELRKAIWLKDKGK